MHTPVNNFMGLPTLVLDKVWWGQIQSPWDKGQLMVLVINLYVPCDLWCVYLIFLKIWLKYETGIIR